MKIYYFSSYFFLYLCSIVLASNIEKTIISKLDDLCILVENQLTIEGCVYFSTLFCSTDMPILSPIKYSINY